MRQEWPNTGTVTLEREKEGIDKLKEIEKKRIQDLCGKINSKMDALEEYINSLDKTAISYNDSIFSTIITHIEGVVNLCELEKTEGVKKIEEQFSKYSEYKNAIDEFERCLNIFHDEIRLMNSSMLLQRNYNVVFTNSKIIDNLQKSVENLDSEG